MALLEYAEHHAAILGDTHPYDIQVVRTTHRKTESLTEAETPQPPAVTPVYVVTMRGRFSCPCSHPYNDPVQPGTAVIFELPAHGMPEPALIRWNLGNRHPHLKALGTPVHLRSTDGH